MNYNNCYNCGSSEHSFYAEENGYTLVKCTTCGLLYINPRPSDDDITEAAKTGVHKGKSKLNVIGRFNTKKVDRYSEILSEIFPVKFTKNIQLTWLDIGAGHGEFLKALQTFINFDKILIGVEPNEMKRKSAQKKGISIYDMNYLQLNNKYHIISALNVFSHLPNPIETFNEWKTLLKPFGEILIQTGNTASLTPKEHPRPLHLPDHLSFASKDIVVDILTKCGFEIISIHFFRSEAFPVFNLRSFLFEIYFLLKNKSFKDRFNFHQKNPNIDMWIRAKPKR